MGRTLDEDAVLKEIGRWIGYLDEDMIERIKIGIKKLPEAQQWIPCSERLPDMYRTYYLVSLADKKEVDVAYFTEYGTWETFRNDEVEAWMPLPDPWKGEQE